MQFTLPLTHQQLFDQSPETFTGPSAYGYRLVSEQRDDGSWELRIQPTVHHLVPIFTALNAKHNEFGNLYLPLAEMVVRLPEVLKLAKDNYTTATGMLLSLLKHEAYLSDSAMRARVAEGNVLFDELGLIYRDRIPVYVSAGSESFGGYLLGVEMQQSMFTGPYYLAQVEVIAANQAGEPVAYRTYARLRYWEGIRHVSELSVHPITDGERAALTDRGRRFKEFALGVKFNNYSGVLRVPTYFGEQLYRANGRVIVDNQSLQFAEPALWNSLMRGMEPVLRDEDEDETGLPKATLQLTDEELWRCWHMVPGYSLKVHEWGLLRVDEMAAIDFRKDAFDLLVMDPQKKRIVRALVEHSKDSFSDIIEGKSGGVIFLLHGDPGVGKTLTAEAVAEVLERPLYSVSVGDLGTHPTDLEESLRKILEMVQRWNAVLLLDEADIFLEARNEHDIHRNAMVGVFLRLLEYHTGVLFLTTNRVKNFDPAFQSRISVALHYPNLTPDTREQITENLLTKAGISADPSTFRDRNLNGRQIKNVLRIAQTLARAENIPVESRHLEEVVALTAEFSDYLAEKA